jgi:hypothetical protein
VFSKSTIGALKTGLIPDVGLETQATAGQETGATYLRIGSKARASLPDLFQIQISKESEKWNGTLSGSLVRETEQPNSTTLMDFLFHGSILHSGYFKLYGIITSWRPRQKIASARGRVPERVGIQIFIEPLL